MSKVTVGSEEIRLEPFSGRKAIRVIRTIEQITRQVPQILDELAEFTRRYEQTNVTELDRTTARYELGPRPVTVQEPIVDEDGKPLEDSSGQVLVRGVAQLDAEGRAVLGPDPLAHMTEEDWAASGNKLRLPKSPSAGERIAAVFPKALDAAEQQVLELLALLVMPNAELKRLARQDMNLLAEALGERAEDLLDAPATDLLELAVAAGELVDEQFTNKLRELGGRLPNALRLLGLKGSQTQETTTGTTSSPSSSESSETKQTSSTDSPAPTSGPSEPSSTVPAGSSSSPSPTG